MFDVTKLKNPKGHVELIETIGKGNFGFVYRGRLIATKEISAVKVVALKEEELREILLEVEILRECDHNNIVKFMGNYVRNDDLWICMEYCGSGAVDALYKQLQRQLSEDEISFIIHQSLAGLVYMHSKHIIHRDIKAANLLLTDDGQVKLADFGVSASTTAATSYRAHTFIGTPYWMAPEVIMSENSPLHMYDAKADVWSLSICVIELADKQVPLSDIHPMRALYMIPSADPVLFMVKQPKKWSKPLVNYLTSTLVKDPRKRPTSDEALKLPWLAKITDQMTLDKDYGKSLVTKAIAEIKSAKELKLATLKRGGAIAQIPKNDDSSDDVDIEAYTQPEQEKNSASKADGKDSKQSANSLSADNTLVEQVSNSRIGNSLSPLRTTMANIFKRRLTSESSNRSEKVDVEADEQDATELVDVTVKMPKEILVQQTSLYSPLSLGIRLKQEVLCSDFVSVTGYDFKDRLKPVQYQFLLLGTDKGLLAVDITHHHNNPTGKDLESMYVYPDGWPRMRWVYKDTKFKQFQVLEDYGVCMVLGGRSNQIRSYRLTSLKKLIRFIYNIEVTSKEGSQQQTSLIEMDEDMLANDSQMDPTINRDSPNFWANDFEKLVNTKESAEFTVTRTKQTCYMTVLFKNRSLTVFEWAKLGHLRFMKVKSFWLPEQPKYFQLCHDGNFVREVLVGYEREANVIEFESSQVIDVKVAEEFKSQISKDCLRFLSWIQLQDVQNGDDKQEEAGSWYHTIKSMKPKSKSDPPPKRDFLATYGGVSKVVGLDGTLQVPKQGQDTYRWGIPCAVDLQLSKDDQLQQIAPQRLVLVDNEYVIGVHKNFMEVLQSQSGQIKQVVRAGNGPMRLLSPVTDTAQRRRGRVYVSTFNKKKKVTHVHWLREPSYDVAAEEKKIHDRDVSDKATKVIGTGAIVKLAAL